MSVVFVQSKVMPYEYEYGYIYIYIFKRPFVSCQFLVINMNVALQFLCAVSFSMHFNYCKNATIYVPQSVNIHYARIKLLF